MNNDSPLNILLADYQERHGLYENFLSRCNHQANFLTDVTWENLNKNRIDIVLVTHEVYFDCPLYIQYAKENDIPTLLLMDGMIEWRNNWEYPLLKTVDKPPLYQPVSCDKVACIGEAQATILESWQNYGRCEVIGYPAYDHLARKRTEFEIGKKDNINILLTTPNRPYFDEQQKMRVVQSLLDVRDFLGGIDRLAGKDFTLRWRLPELLSDIPQFSQLTTSFKDNPVWGDLSWADMVIGTPTTIMYATIALSKPFVVMDYTCSPLYYTPTWLINGKENIEFVISDASDPSREKQLHHEYLLDSNMSNLGSASDKLFELIRSQVACHRAKTNSEIYLIKNSRIDRIDTRTDFLKLQNSDNPLNKSSTKLRIINETKRLKHVIDDLSQSNIRYKKTINELDSLNKVNDQKTRQLEKDIALGEQRVSEENSRYLEILNSRSYTLGFKLLQPLRFFRKLIKRVNHG